MAGWNGRRGVRVDARSSGAWTRWWCGRDVPTIGVRERDRTERDDEGERFSRRDAAQVYEQR